MKLVIILVFCFLNIASFFKINDMMMKGLVLTILSTLTTLTISAIDYHVESKEKNELSTIYIETYRIINKIYNGKENINICNIICYLEEVIDDYIEFVKKYL